MLPGRISRRTLLAGVAGSVIAEPRASAGTPASVVVMIADVRESGADAILSLGEGAARFERAYTACPSPDAGRLAVLNGRYPHFGGLEGGTDLVACFAAAGWKTMRDRLPAGVKRSLAVLEPGPGEDMECLRSALALPGDTLVVFTAARGAASDSWFETSARVPLLFHWPRALAAGDRDELACGVDVMPTILRLCDISPPEGIHGRDLLAPAAESVYVEGRLGKRDEWRMIVRGLDKIVFRPDLRILHLYNLGQDPEEKTDLATALSEQRKRDELMALAELWMKQLDDHIDPSGLKMR